MSYWKHAKGDNVWSRGPVTITTWLVGTRTVYVVLMAGVVCLEYRTWPEADYHARELIRESSTRRR